MFFLLIVSPEDISCVHSDLSYEPIVKDNNLSI